MDVALLGHAPVELMARPCRGHHGSGGHRAIFQALRAHDQALAHAAAPVHANTSEARLRITLRLKDAGTGVKGCTTLSSGRRGGRQGTLNRRRTGSAESPPAVLRIIANEPAARPRRTRTEPCCRGTKRCAGGAYGGPSYEA